MPQVTFDVPDRVINALVGLYRQPNVGIDGEDPDAQLSDGAWARKWLKRFMIKQTKRYEQMVARQNAADAVDVPDDIIE